jgi:hypothetical protein
MCVMVGKNLEQLQEYQAHCAEVGKGRPFLHAAMLLGQEQRQKCNINLLPGISGSELRSCAKLKSVTN